MPLMPGIELQKHYNALDKDSDPLIEKYPREIERGVTETDAGKAHQISSDERMHAIRLIETPS